MNTQVHPKLDLVVLDCPDPLVLGRFYADVLGWEVEDGSDRDFATLVPPGGGLTPENPDGHVTLAFQRIDDWVEPTWPAGHHPQQFPWICRCRTSTRPSPRSWLSAPGYTPTSHRRTGASGSISIGRSSVLPDSRLTAVRPRAEPECNLKWSARDEWYQMMKRVT